MSARLELTPLGQWVNQYSVSTTPEWWRKVFREVERMADADEDWEFMLGERIAGLQSFLERRRTEGAPEYWSGERER